MGSRARSSSERSEVGGRRIPDRAVASQVPASQSLAQPCVLTLELDHLPAQLALGRPQLLAADTPCSPQAH
jgi:hypothetical protein